MATVQPQAPSNVVVGRPVGQIGQGVENPHVGTPVHSDGGAGGTPPRTSHVVPMMQPLDPATTVQPQAGRVSGGPGFGQPQRVVFLPGNSSGSRPPMMMIMMDQNGGATGAPRQSHGPNHVIVHNGGPGGAGTNYVHHGPYGPSHPTHVGGSDFFQQSYGDMSSVYPPTLLAVLTCLCCFFPGGICACLSLLKCQEGHAALARNDFENARKAKEEAMRWIYASWAATLFFMIFYSIR